MKIARWFLVLPWVILLSACAGGELLHQRRAIVAEAKTVAVVNAIGRQALVEYFGFTVFSNFEHFADISEWGIDKAIQAEVQRALPKHLLLKSVEYAPELERTYYLPKGARGLRVDTGEKELFSYLDALKKRSQVDLVLFVLPGNYPALRLSNREKLIRFQPVAIADVHAKILLFDTRTMRDVFSPSFFPRCWEPVRDFAYRKESMASQIEQRREELHKRWLSCFSGQRTEYEAAFDGQCSVGSCQ